ncbi:L-alanyl-D-glutamate peptidase [Chloroherpeton thalassium ATCC 35110]|uniref:L-alanyl-D-glutamate peptidase n=1 Tax=Chloroherpeton thalassium (strain ATCC 35110 / GB-78) TaxID=517418 RepID=B3QTK0_CHLT3|nr:M15 family metallopeptidase [Chloroherpeton thalassium]ACF12746.1 L-alanyl-D-glutamate peptidase [Chloroherpeton thalassium ATCC 35110]
MPKFSETSKARLAKCDARLQEIFYAVVTKADCSILEGHRNEQKQRMMLMQGRTKLAWPNSKHNRVPSLAVDVAPYPIIWDERERFIYFAGFVKGIAAAKGIGLRWGGDWDMDNSLKDNRFDDLVHFELIES